MSEVPRMGEVGEYRGCGLWMTVFSVYVAGGITRPFISPTLSPGKPKFSTNMGVGVVFPIVLV